MSELGHFQPNWAVRVMSAFPPIATDLRTSRIGSFVPGTEVAGLPRIPHHALAGIACGDVGELALEGGCGRPAGDPSRRWRWSAPSRAPVLHH